MSFSSEVKEEILEYYSKKKDQYLVKAERFGEYLTGAQYKNDLLEEFNDYFNISLLAEDEIKSVIKGVFLGSGCIVDPLRDYRYEAGFKNKACAEYYLDLLSLLEFTPKIVKRNKAGLYIVYFKESEQISYMLSILEVNRAVLKFEQIRVEKEVSNSQNRLSNCENANMAKVVNSALIQIDAIKKLRESGRFVLLNEKLQYTASLREKYPTDTLEFISSKTSGKNKVSKSGLKHRLDKIISLSSEI